MTNSFNFDRIIDRRTSASLKWSKYNDQDTIPLWVADMDFASPPAVMQALHERIDHGVFGYTKMPDDLYEAIIERMSALYDWEVEREWIVPIPCLVCGINLACRSVGHDGDSVLSVTPIYPPFLSAPDNSRRELVTAPLALDGDRWTMDLDAMDNAINERTKLFMFCNPHNPTGRIYSKSEMLAMANWCEKNDLVICSDEIHCDLLLEPGMQHTPIASLDPEIARRTITLMSPSKTFNIAGMGFGFAVIPNLDLRANFKKEMAGIVPHVNLMGYEAALAAYRYGGEWLSAVLEYLRGNRDALQETVANCSGISMTHIEATFLGWIDVRNLGLNEPHTWFEQYGLGFSNGADFDGEGFVRFNFGCPRSVLQRALERLVLAVESV